MKRNILLNGLLLTASSFAQGGKPEKKTPTKIVVKGILEFYDVPLLFLGRDEKEQAYMCVLEGKRYICALTKEEDLAEYSAGVIDLKMVFEQSQQWYSVTEDSITPMSKDESFLPEAGFFSQKDLQLSTQREGEIVFYNKYGESLYGEANNLILDERRKRLGIVERPKIDAPVVMVCRNRWEQYYMCVFLESRTIALKVNDNLLNSYFAKKISIRRVFLLADTWFDMDGVMEEMKRDNTLFPEELYHKEFNRGFIESETFQPLTDYISSRCTLDVLPWLGIVEKEKIVLLAEKKREFQRGRKK